MEQLRLLAQTGCTGSLIITDDITLGVIFLHDGTVIDAIVTDGPWIGEGVQAVAFLANLESGHITVRDHLALRQTDRGRRSDRTRGPGGADSPPAFARATG